MSDKEFKMVYKLSEVAWTEHLRSQKYRNWTPRQEVDNESGFTIGFITAWKKAREEVFRLLEDNSIKAVLPRNRIHICIREDIFEKLKST